MELSATLINGKPADCIPVTDRGVQYGDGVFETMAVMNADIPLWSYHYQRLQYGCDRLGIEIPELMELQAEMIQLMHAVPHAIIKLILTRGAGKRGYAPAPLSPPTRILQRYPWPDVEQSYTQTGIKVRRCQFQMAHQPALAGIKHLNRLEQVLARAEWTDATVAEGLVGDIAGHIIEATAHNVFIVEAGSLLTPALTHCGVAGVMRQWIVDHAPEWNIPLAVCDISWERLYQADEVFLCNSIHGLWPVRQCESQIYSLGPVTQQIGRAYEQWLVRR